MTANASFRWVSRGPDAFGPHLEGVAGVLCIRVDESGIGGETQRHSRPTAAGRESGSVRFPHLLPSPCTAGGFSYLHTVVLSTFLVPRSYIIFSTFLAPYSKWVSQVSIVVPTYFPRRYLHPFLYSNYRSQSYCKPDAEGRCTTGLYSRTICGVHRRVPSQS